MSKGLDQGKTQRYSASHSDPFFAYSLSVCSEWGYTLKPFTSYSWNSVWKITLGS